MYQHLWHHRVFIQFVDMHPSKLDLRFTTDYGHLAIGQFRVEHDVVLMAKSAVLLKNMLMNKAAASNLWGEARLLCKLSCERVLGTLAKLNMSTRQIAVLTSN
ncbi:MAG: hypothetical protein HBSAPP03_08690 [Phycisphaerae bacterium]|nr:MAG: hypothetical protein HBSAPP03_08690 [Phycisphaerae bacterium]